MKSNSFKRAVFSTPVLIVFGMGSACSGANNNSIDYREVAQKLITIGCESRIKYPRDLLEINPTFVTPREKFTGKGATEIRTVELINNYAHYVSGAKYEALLNTADWDKITKDVTLKAGATIYHLNPDGTMKSADQDNGQFKTLSIDANTYVIEDWRNGELSFNRFYTYDDAGNLLSKAVKRGSGEIVETVNYQYDASKRLLSRVTADKSGAVNYSKHCEYSPEGHLTKVISTSKWSDDYTSIIDYNDKNREVSGVSENAVTSSNFKLKILSDKSYIYDDKEGRNEITRDDDGNILTHKKSGTTETLRFDTRAIEQLPIKEDTQRETTDMGFQISTKTQNGKSNTQYSNQTTLSVKEYWLDKNGNLIAKINKSDTEVDGPQLDVTRANYAYFKYE